MTRPSREAEAGVERMSGVANLGPLFTQAHPAHRSAPRPQPETPERCGCSSGPEIIVKPRCYTAEQCAFMTQIRREEVVVWLGPFWYWRFDDFVSAALGRPMCWHAATTDDFARTLAWLAEQPQMSRADDVSPA